MGRRKKVGGHYRSSRATRKQIRALLYIIGQPENQARPSFQARKKNIHTKEGSTPNFLCFGAAENKPEILKHIAELSKDGAETTKKKGRLTVLYGRTY